jgi:hypothetical protein
MKMILKRKIRGLTRSCKGNCSECRSNISCRNVRKEYFMENLEMKVRLLERENEQLKKEKEDWRNEAIKQTAAHGETKMKITKLINNHLGVSNE